MRLVLWPAVAACCLAATVQRPDANEIVRRSVQAIDADWAQAPHYSFVERDAESKHDSRPVIKTYEVLMIDGSQYGRVIAVNDQPLSGGQKADEELNVVFETAKRVSEKDE